ncbi:uncharacterized protein LOC128963619 [Oppia nitens]|uniref:uncharacterized protein LOC128963619 n=1 Tax=Oppia nitens TaxID=1686743 RepID=UPI0023DB440B|nr:uncharacterized protein LOC128963619 [Oppia nitens]
MFLGFKTKSTDPKPYELERDSKRVTEQELTHLNHKIDKLLLKLEDETDQQLATSPDEECVICISSVATMQTYPCGHRVVCRKCFVKTIQMVVSQRMLPLRCVICRSKILRLKQTTRGGLNTGHVLRTGRNYVNTNPFYISPASSPVSPVTEVFREQRAVFVRHYVEFGYDPNGQSPVSSPCEAYSRSGGSNCVLHKHCIDNTTKAKSTELSPNCSSSSSLPNTLSSSIDNCSSKSNATSFQWEFNRKRKYSRSLHRHRRSSKTGSRSGTSRPNSLLLPIDETEELQELSSNTDESIETSKSKVTSSASFSSSSSSSIENVESDDICPNILQPTNHSSSLSSRLSDTWIKAKKWIKREKVHKESET